MSAYRLIDGPNEGCSSTRPKNCDAHSLDNSYISQTRMKKT